MEIQDLNVGVFQNGMVRVMDEIARGTAQSQGYSSSKMLALLGLRLLSYLFPFYLIDVIILFCKGYKIHDILVPIAGNRKASSRRGGRQVPVLYCRSG